VSSTDDLDLFAVSPPGLEPFTARELRELGIRLNRPSPSKDAGAAKKGEDETGGVGFSGSLGDLYRANLYLRTASRVLLRLGSFPAVSFPELRRKAGLLRWEDFLLPGRPVILRATCRGSRLYHEGAVAERIAGAIADRLGKAPPLEKPGKQAEAFVSQLILVRVVDNLCTLSVDSSGDLLHRRGYRLDTAKAPLRETLAAGMLIASGWDMTSPLLDPFCGSGTIPIEAAMMALRLPPGRRRRFAFMEWLGFDSRIWERLIAGPFEPAVGRLPSITASDRDAGAIAAAMANAERAGLAGSIGFFCRSVSAIEPPSGPGWIVTNPPYGVRTRTNRDLRNLYPRFGGVLRERCPGWHFAILSSSLSLIRTTGLKIDQKGVPLDNGGLKVSLVRGRVREKTS